MINVFMHKQLLKVTGKIFRAHNSALIILLIPLFVSSQQRTDSLIQNATLENVVRYALQRNPDLKNASLDEQITQTTIKSKLADWYPQINFNYVLQHNFKLPTANFNGQYIKTGLNNTSGLIFSATQNIFNRDVVLASRTARSVRLQTRQNTTEQKINIASQVSKAFYDVM